MHMQCGPAQVQMCSGPKYSGAAGVLSTAVVASVIHETVVGVDACKDLQLSSSPITRPSPAMPSTRAGAKQVQHLTQQRRSQQQPVRQRTQALPSSQHTRLDTTPTVPANVPQPSFQSSPKPAQQADQPAPRPQARQPSPVGQHGHITPFPPNAASKPRLKLPLAPRPPNPQRLSTAEQGPPQPPAPATQPAAKSPKAVLDAPVRLLQGSRVSFQVPPPTTQPPSSGRPGKYAPTSMTMPASTGLPAPSPSAQHGQSPHNPNLLVPAAQLSLHASEASAEARQALLPRQTPTSSKPQPSTEKLAHPSCARQLAAERMQPASLKVRPRLLACRCSGGLLTASSRKHSSNPALHTMPCTIWVPASIARKARASLGTM